MFDNFVLPELVDLAKSILNEKGEEVLIDYKAYNSWCGCMGPKRGERLCPCSQGSALETNMVEIVSQFDEILAKKIWLAKFVASLPG
jgi:hypothetical protein